MTEYGVWSEAEGGFVEDGLWTKEQAAQEVENIVAQFPEDERAQARADHSVKAFCHDHRDDDQPADGCELCADDADEDDEQDGDQR